MLTLAALTAASVCAAPAGFAASNVPLDGPAIALAARKVACALGAGGRLSCWRRDETSTSPPLVRAERPGAVQVGVGQRLVCTRTSAGTVDCARLEPSEGGLGLGESLSLPVTGVTALAVGADDRVYVATDDGVSVLRADSAAAPAPVLAHGDVVALSASHDGGCALRAGGRVVCFGGPAGWLAQGDLRADASAATSGVELSQVSDAALVSVSGSHACLLRQSGQALCFGSRPWAPHAAAGELTAWRTPEPLAGLSVGDERTCALLRSGRATCRGRSDLDLGLDDVVALATGKTEICALRRGGVVTCVGPSPRPPPPPPPPELAKQPELVATYAGRVLVGGGRRLGREGLFELGVELDLLVGPANWPVQRVAIGPFVDVRTRDFDDLAVSGGLELVGSNVHYAAAGLALGGGVVRRDAERIRALMAIGRVGFRAPFRSMMDDDWWRHESVEPTRFLWSLEMMLYVAVRKELDARGAYEVTFGLDGDPMVIAAALALPWIE